MRRVATLTAIVLMLSVQGESQGLAVEGAFDRTFSVSQTADLTVSTKSGNIRIRSGSSNRVEVHAEIRVGKGVFRGEAETRALVRQIESDPPVEQDGDSVRIGQLLGNWQNVSIAYDITVPPQSSVTARASSGSITISEVQGSVRAQTHSGKIRTNGVSGDCDLGTSSGSIDVRDTTGALRAHTSSGGITAQGQQTALWKLTASSGSIRVRMPDEAKFDLSAHSSSGSVYVARPLTVQGRLNRQRNSVTGQSGGGGYALDIHTASGSIRIE